jgi:transcriptional regulator with XRE-family HTH domain
MTQKDLAGQLGISVSNLSTIERGDKYPRVEMLKKIARILDVPLEELFVLPDTINQQKHSS